MHKLKIFSTTALVALALTVGITGCSPIATEGARPVAPQTQESAPAPAQSDTDLYLEILDSESYFSSVPEDMLIETGEAICFAFDSGATVEQVMQLGVDNGIPQYEAGYMVGAAIHALCPEYYEKAQDFLGGA